MIEKKDSTYTLSQDASRLIFRTSSFVADRGSVLHSGIYNREFSSVLASFALAGIAFFLLVMSYGKKTVFYAVFLLLFIGTFPLFRAYVFRERYRQTVFDRTTATVEIRHAGIGSKVLLNKPFASIRGIWIETKKTEVVNRDGIAFVEKISAQHGTVIPGFGEEKTFYTLKLGFTDGTEKTLFADSIMQDVIAVHDRIKGFLNI
ncbi:MAG: hypothetical protein LUO98_03425 [Methanoregula sp.]|nr:hypothetical protein [Methanoregula sp.]